MKKEEFLTHLSLVLLQTMHLYLIKNTSLVYTYHIIVFVLMFILFEEKLTETITHVLNS